MNEGGTHVDVEIWQLPLASFAALLMSEPAGLAIGKIKLADGSEVLGVLAENWLTEGQRKLQNWVAGVNTPGIFILCNAHL